MKVCCNSSVGALILDRDDRLLMFDRNTPPFAVAPPAGHVFDEHGDRDDKEEAYRNAACAEVFEEVGLTVTSLKRVWSGWTDPRCRRESTVSGRFGHEWRVFKVEVTGQLAPSERETRNARWLSWKELQELTDRTVDWARGEVSDVSFASQPGLEPVWVLILSEIGLVRADVADVNRVMAEANRLLTI